MSPAVPAPTFFKNCQVPHPLWSPEMHPCFIVPHTVLELFEAWQGRFAWHRHIDVWRLVPHCLIWCIWRERNARSFEGCERSLPEIKSFSCTLSLNGVWFFLIFLVLPFLFFLTVVLLFLDLCPHSTSPMYSAWHFSYY